MTCPLRNIDSALLNDGEYRSRALRRLRFLANSAGRPPMRESSVVNRLTRLVSTPLVTLDRFEHVAGVAHRDPDEELSTRYGVNFVESGSFRLSAERRRHQLVSESIFVTTPGLVFSCEHDVEHPDDRCLSIGYSESSIEDLWRAGAARTQAPVLTPTLRRAYLHRRVQSCVAGDEARLEALAAAV